MRFRKVTKMVMSLAFAFSLATAVLTPVLEVEAASTAVERRYILGDGVRLRKEGYSGGTVLELMYDGEAIDYYPDIYGSDTEYNYMCRLATGTYGYVDHHYTRMNP